MADQPAKRVLDTTELYPRGLQDRAALDPLERFVVAVIDLECLADMEGWPHFFCSPASASFYPALRSGLAAVGDHASVSVLDDFETYLRGEGVAFAPEAIEDHLASLDDHAAEALPDWGERFAAATEERWRLIARHLRSQGVELLEASAAAEGTERR
jgi:hypothetical protein